MTTKFTPGPWVRHKHAYCCVVADSRVLIANCGQRDSNINREELEIEQDANTQLIAAAPDLYAALESFVNFKSDGNTSVVDDDQLWLKAEQALQKARGDV